MNEEITNQIIDSDINYSNYNALNNIYTTVNVLTFTIIIIFLYKFLKTNFSFRK